MQLRWPLIIAAATASLCAAVPCALAQSKIVATVDGNPITEADLQLAEREIGGDAELAPDERRRVLLEVLIQRQVLAAAAEQAKLSDGQDFAARLAYSRRNLLQQLFLEKRAREMVTEADAKRVYDQQSAAMKPEQEVHARHIVVESAAQAKALLARIKKGADFANLARSNSSDLATARRGGDLGWRTRSELPDKLATAIFVLTKKGDLAPPLQTDAGWHVIRLEDRRVRTVPEFAVLKDHIIRLLVQEKVRELAKDLRGKATVSYLDPTLRMDAVASAATTATSVKAIFEKYNLLGAFAWDCSKPASRDNFYFINRLVEPDRVQREQMDSPTTRNWFTIIDKVEETGRNEIRVSGQITGVVRGQFIEGQPAEGIWRIEQNRMLQWEATLAGQKTIAEGKFLATGRQMPWLHKCPAR